MSQYLTALTQGQTGGAFGRVIITPTTLAVKISKVSRFAPGTAYINIYRSPSAISSGGTAYTPSPMRTRTGTPSGLPATATVKYNVTSVSGTPTYFVYQGSTPDPFEPKADLIVAPGTTFVVEAYLPSAGAVGQYFTDLSIYSEELRLAYSL